MCGGGETVTHLQFADDTILFCSSNQEEVVNLKQVLRCFQLCSGLKINLSKSLLVGVGCPKETIKDLANLIHCNAGKLPISYLGLPIGGKPRFKEMWSLVVERVERKFSIWKRKYLSFGGRITLIKSSLSNIPVYYLSLYNMPKKVCETLDRLRRDFLWEGNYDKRKIRLMKWREVIKPKRYGGLGLGDL